MSLQDNDKLSALLRQLPEGVAAPSVWFEAQGYSRQLLYKYVQSGWLVKLGRGVYMRPGTTLDWRGVGLGLQRLAHLPFHLGGITALNQQGYAHYLPLGGEHVIHWFGNTAVPAWLHSVNLPQTFHFHARQLFDDKAATVGLTELPTKTRDWTLNTSAPERAILEILYQVEQSGGISFQHAAELFEGLSVLRPAVLNELLATCNSIKAKRMFLFLADYNQHSWVKRLERDNIMLGSGKLQLVKSGRLHKQYQITVPESFLAY